MKSILILSISVFVLIAAPSDDKFERAQSAVNASSAGNDVNNTVKYSESAYKLAPTNSQAKRGKVSIKDATMKAINNYRTSFQTCSKPKKALIWNPYYYNIAKEHSIDMAVNQRVSHDGSSTQTDITAKRLKINRGSKFYERVNQKVGSKDLISGELVVATKSVFYKTPREIIQYWMNKPKSCAVIMNPKFTDVALSKVISNQNGKAYWTLLLIGRGKK